MDTVQHNLQVFAQFKATRPLKFGDLKKIVVALKTVAKEEGLAAVIANRKAETFVFQLRYPPRVSLSGVLARLRFLCGDVWEYGYQMSSCTDPESALESLRQLAEPK